MTTPVAEISAQPEVGHGSITLGLPRRVGAECVGSALLVLAVVGSGIMASRLSPNDVGLQLLQNAAATAAALIGLILMFGAVSGAHFNPVVTLVSRAFGAISTREAVAYVPAQLAGAVGGALLANYLFGLGVVEVSTTERSSGPLWVSEIVATATLLLVIYGCVRSGRSGVVAFAVGAWIGGAYFFTSSTSFANPAVTFGRVFTDTFAGIAPNSAWVFVVMQLIGAVVAYGLIRTFFPFPDRSERSP